MALKIKEEVIKQDAEAPLHLVGNRLSYNGLQVLAGQIIEDCNRDLRWPHCMITYKAMLKDATISAALDLMEMNITKVKWKVRIPKGHEAELKDKAEFIESCMNDMDDSWTDFIRQASTFNRFGFAPIEKVYRKRLRAEGSRYNDGLYGIRELPLISQDSITSWEWGNSGREIVGLYQKKNIPEGKGTYNHSIINDDVFIRKNKFMLFRTGQTKDSPVGTSPLNKVYMAWRFKDELQRQEGIGVASDVRGLKVIYVPPRYLSDSATPEEKETADYFKTALATMHVGEQSGILLPQLYNDEGKKMFEFEVVSVLGSASHDIDKIISRYRKEIVTGIMAPQLVIGQDGSGSFALSESLEGITATVVESRLVEIQDQLNHDLIPQLFLINGWDTSVMPYFEFEEVSRTNIDDWSKAVQRIASNGLVKLDARTINSVHTKLGFEVAYDDEGVSVEEIRENSTTAKSAAGAGMLSPSGEGTSLDPLESDTTSSNKEN